MFVLFLSITLKHLAASFRHPKPPLPIIPFDIVAYACTRLWNNLSQDKDSLRRRANARNVSFRISLRWPIHIINPVDKTKLRCYTSHRRSTTVSLETYPYISYSRQLFTITTEIHARSLVNFYRQYADRHMNLKFM